MSTTAFRSCGVDPKLVNYRSMTQFWDFHNYTTAQDGLTTVSGSSGSTAISADAGFVHGGYLKLTTAATSGDAQSVRTTNQPYIFATGQPIGFETLIYYTNQATTTGAIFAGFSSNTAAELTSGGLLSTTSYSGAGLVKQKGDTVWSFQCSNATTKTNFTSVQTGTDGAYILKLDVQDWDSANVVVIPRVNGVQLFDSNNQPIKGVISKTSAVKMYARVDVMAGSANVQTAYIDYLEVHGLRQSVGNLVF